MCVCVGISAHTVCVHTHYLYACASELERGGETVGDVNGRAVRFSKSGGPFS